MITLKGCQYFYSGAVQHMEGSLAYHTHCFGVGRPVYMERTQDTWHWHKKQTCFMPYLTGRKCSLEFKFCYLANGEFAEF